MNDGISFERKKIGIFDSGMGGISVLREMNRFFSGVDFFYYGDITNSPYGKKSKDEITRLTKIACDYFLKKKVDAVLLACNTATSASVKLLRGLYPVPIFGMEPAVKPALTENPEKKIAVLATQFTISEEKFLELERSLNANGRLVSYPCEGLAALVDKKKIEEAGEFLKPILEKIQSEKIDTIVLGCTHYVLLKKVFSSLNPSIKLYDGNAGTYSHIQKSLGISMSNQLENRVELFLNGGSESDYSIARFYLNEPF